MMKSPGRAALALFAGGAALIGAAIPAQAVALTGPGWRVNTTLASRGVNTFLTSVDAVNAGDAWEIGYSIPTRGGAIKSVLRHWAGSSWKAVYPPASIARKWNGARPTTAQVAAVNSTDVWAFSSRPGGRYLRLNGKRWTMGALPGTNSRTGASVVITAATAASADDAWAFGAEVHSPKHGRVTIAPYAAHWNGKGWTSQKMPGTGPILAASALPPGSMWAVVGTATSGLGLKGTSGRYAPYALEWTPHGGWQKNPVQPKLPAGANLSSVVDCSFGFVWVGGSEKNAKGTTPVAAEWNGNTWAVQTLPTGVSTSDWSLTDMVTDGGGGIWALATARNTQAERIWHLPSGGKAWAAVNPNFGRHKWELSQLAAVPASESVWAVGATLSDGLIAIEGPTPN